jgi:hypothetical protein
MMITSMKKILLTGLISSTALFAQEYEERPAIGLYTEYTNIELESFTYKERIADDNDNVIHYELAKDLEVSPLVGITAHLPFIWPNYLTANAILAGQFHTYELTAMKKEVPITKQDSNIYKNYPTDNISNRTLAVDNNSTTKRLKTFSFMIEGGPEVAVPLYTNYETQTMFKVFVFGHVSLGQSFNFDTNFEKALYLGAFYGAGFRYAYQRISFGAGFKNGITRWHPSYDPSKGSIDSSTPDKQNDLLVIYEQFFNPFLEVKWAIY